MAAIIEFRFPTEEFALEETLDHDWEDMYIESAPSI